MLLLSLLVGSLLGQQPEPVHVTLEARTPAAGETLRWSPKGSKVPLAEDGDGTLTGSFALGPKGAAPIKVRLERSAAATHYDVLWVDADRDGTLDDDERLTTEPHEQRGKWWSSFTAELRVPMPPAEDGAAPTRPYPVALWFVEDPREPDAEPVLRWSRRGWHEGAFEVGGKKAFVLLTDMAMDGILDQRDAWALARDRKALLAAPSRTLENHCWLDGTAYRAVRIDPNGRFVDFEAFDPGITEAEERAANDRYAADRAAPRAKHPVAFQGDFEAALAEAKSRGRRLFVDFQTTWCGPCHLMAQIVYTAAPVAEAAEDVVAVQVDGDDRRDLVDRFGVSAYPTMILLDSDGTEIRRAVGYRGVAAMAEFLGH